MINTVCEKNMCCGCNACVNICPKQCIKLVDSIKSLDAVIDVSLCIDCHQCEKVCQVINPNNHLISKNETINCLEGSAKNDLIYNNSSSGGFASTLGLEFAKKGGFVVGIKNDLNGFVFDITNNSDEILNFSGSKYVKVNTGNLYKMVKERLLKNDKVLFFGVPCQIAGLKMFLQKEYDDLYTVDLICHGTPSDKVLMKYLSECGIKDTKGLKFRNKKNIQLYVNEKPVVTNSACDPYTIGFLNELFYTNNCYFCNYACNKRIGDLTIGDSWGSLNEGKYNLHNLSLILQNTKKGEFLLNIVDDVFTLINCNYENAKKNNHQLNYPSNKQKFTDYYFDHFNDMTTKKIIKKAFPKILLKKKIKYILIKLHLLRR